MSVQPLRKEQARNPRTVEEARAFVAHVESLFMPWNIDALVDGFTVAVLSIGRDPESHGADVLLILAHQQVLDFCSATQSQQ